MHPIRTLAWTAPLAVAGAAHAQIPVFSVGWNGPTISVPDSFTGTPITEGDLLAPMLSVPAIGPLLPPGIVESAGVLPPVGLGLANHAACVGHPPYTPCLVEVDALSHGLDAIVRCVPVLPGAVTRQWAFSVQVRSMGVPGSPLPPAVWTEGPCQDDAADVFVDLGTPCGPLPPVAGLAGNTGYIDGDGLPSCFGSVYPGTGLKEYPPGALFGDNLDALDDDVPDLWLPRTTCTYFSLDGAFVDPVLGVPNSGSAAAAGFAPGDVLRSCPGCAPAVYAPALLLGLDLLGPGTDDLDALALRENGIAGYQRSFAPYDWTSGQTDMLFFSVRRGSAIVGVPDAFFGLPIEPGDVLVPAGPVGSPPGIWIAAEDLGLATQRSAGVISDDMDALDTLHEPQPGNGFCFGDGSGVACPCGNNGASGRGCGNSVNALGALLWANGTPSISNDTVLMTASGMPNTTNALLYQGTLPLLGVPFGDGLRCAGGNVRRLMIRTALCGNREFGWGVPGDPKISVAGGVIAPGSVYYQVNYRDANPTFCSVPDRFNWTNGYRITWVP